MVLLQAPSLFAYHTALVHFRSALDRFFIIPDSRKHFGACQTSGRPKAAASVTASIFVSNCRDYFPSREFTSWCWTLNLRDSSWTNAMLNCLFSFTSYPRNSPIHLMHRHRADHMPKQNYFLSRCHRIDATSRNLS